MNGSADRAVTAYVDRLREILPPSRADDVAREVESLVADRVEREGGSHDDPEAWRRALASMGPPEALAEALVGGSITIDLATRRAFVRFLAVVFAGHLLLSVLLAVLRAGAPLVPGLLGALPTSSWVETGLGVIGIFLADAGLLLVVFALLGRDRSPALLGRLRLSVPVTRRDAVLSLVLVALIAVILNVPSVRDVLLAVGPSEDRVPLLAGETLAILPWVDLMLTFLAMRQVLLIGAARETAPAVALDALACLAGILVCVLVVLKGEFARVGPGAGLSAAQGALLADLLLRIAVLLAVVGALVLASRFVRRALRLRQLLAPRGR